ncbi:hypothetical protein NOR_05679 [Metarhizium rileyi]|uniref:Uncharacterized protein n=1 Tax=Metarhizium rileyi (strain RCEF 4871) TaxID=1649241 RepID=A0A167BZ18_METRR|nr:hypothetical protein NOR_05679 [Metarhizium rileyi RCEF 4871]TWU76246.1 hypothetical protein ED733_004843 [Metarhizium rileyi]
MSADGSADPQFWLNQLERVLCDRHRELGHQCTQIREEIATYVANLLTDTAEQDAMDVSYFIWCLIEEWAANGRTNLRLSQPPPQTDYLLSIGQIEALRYMPRKSSITDWDHATLCSGELCNAIRSVIGMPTVSFKSLLLERGIQCPDGDPPQDDASRLNADMFPPVTGDIHTWADYIVLLERELTRARKAVISVKKQNVEMAIKLSETQNQVHSLEKTLGMYQYP